MTNEEIIDGLKFTMDMCLFSSVDGSKRPISMLNDMDKITYNACEGAIKVLEQTRWIPCNERLPKENEYIGNVCKYYLIQDEYGDMHVAHLSNVGWIPMDSLKAIGNEIIAWKELPQAYVPEINVGDIEESEEYNYKALWEQTQIVKWLEELRLYRLHYDKAAERIQRKMKESKDYVVINNKRYVSFSELCEILEGKDFLKEGD